MDNRHKSTLDVLKAIASMEVTEDTDRGELLALCIAMAKVELKKKEISLEERNGEYTPGPWKATPSNTDNEIVFLDPMNYEIHVGGAKETGFTEEELTNTKLMGAAPELLETLKEMVQAYGRLHIFLSDSIKGRRLTGADIPDDFDAIVAQLTGPCYEASVKSNKLLKYF